MTPTSNILAEITMNAQSIPIRWTHGPLAKGYAVYRCSFNGVCFSVMAMSVDDASLARRHGVTVEVVP